MASIYPVRTGWPIPPEVGAAGTVNTLVIDGQNEAVALVFEAPEDLTITQIIYINSAKTGTPANDSYTASIQSVNASGNPGGIIGGGSPASVTFPNATYPVAGFGSNTSHIFTLANAANLTRGTKYAIVVQKTGATDAANFLTARAGNTATGLPVAMPYMLTADTTPTWTKLGRMPMACLAIRSASRTYLWPALSTGTSQNVGNTAEAGFTFTMPSGFGSNTFGLRGVHIMLQSTGIAVGGTVTLTLYGDPLTTPTILQQALQLDSDMFMTGTSRGVEIMFPEATLAQLVPGTKYAVGFVHSAAASASISLITLPDAGCRDAYPLGGLTLASRTLTSYPPSGNDTNAFAETTTTILFAELIFGEFTASSSGGGNNQPLAGVPRLHSNFGGQF